MLYPFPLFHSPPFSSDVTIENGYHEPKGGVNLLKLDVNEAFYLIHGAGFLDGQHIASPRSRSTRKGSFRGVGLT
jgi:hypothetical protein